MDRPEDQWGCEEDRVGRTQLIVALPFLVTLLLFMVCGKVIVSTYGVKIFSFLSAGFVFMTRVFNLVSMFY